MIATDGEHSRAAASWRDRYATVPITRTNATARSHSRLAAWTLRPLRWRRSDARRPPGRDLFGSAPCSSSQRTPARSVQSSLRWSIVVNPAGDSRPLSATACIASPSKPSGAGKRPRRRGQGPRHARVAAASVRRGGHPRRAVHGTLEDRRRLMRRLKEAGVRIRAGVEQRPRRANEPVRAAEPQIAREA